MLIVTISPWYREGYRMCRMYPHQVLQKIKSGWQKKKPETTNVTTVKVMGHNANRTNTSCHVFHAIRQTKAEARQFSKGPGIGLKQSPISLRKPESLNHTVSIYHMRWSCWQWQRWHWVCRKTEHWTTYGTYIIWPETATLMKTQNVQRNCGKAFWKSMLPPPTGHSPLVAIHLPDVLVVEIK